MLQVLPEKVTVAAKELKKHFVTYPDFPKKGINFWDVFALFRKREAFDLLNDMLSGYAELFQNKVDVVVGIESRGFLIGTLLANLLNCAFVPIRKKGKLPGKTKEVSYTIEYGMDVMEIQEESIKSGQQVLIIDDCLATGGTICAAFELVKKLGANVLDCVVIYNIPELDEKKDVIECVTTLCK
ncbi:hypothetical protein PGB90_004436 [Kerria lacca]